MNYLSIMRTLLLSVVFFSLTILSLSLSSCSDQDDCAGTVMKFQLLEDSGSCGFLLTISLDDEWRTLLPLNLSDFDVQPEQNVEVCVTFIERPDVLVNCVLGEPVDILSITII